MKKLLVLVLTLALAFGTFSFAAAAVPADVVGTDYEDAATRLGALGIMVGDERGFRPDDAITRAEFAVLMVRALGLEPAAKFSTAPTKFADVTDSYSWAWGYINVAVEQGVIKGYSETAYGPGDAVTYEQAITMIVRALGYEPAVVGGYPAGYLAKAAELGVTDDVTVAAGVGAPRGAVAQMLDNSLEVELMMRDTYGDTAEYKAKADTSLLVTKIGVKLYEEKVVEEVDKTEREIVINGDTLKVADGILLDGLLDAEVTAWKLDGKVVYISTDSKVIFDSIDDVDDVTKDDKITLYNADKTYKTTVAAVDVNAMTDGQYGKFIVNNSKITDAVLYDLTYVKGGMVTSVDTSDEEIKYFVGTGSTRTLRLADADDVVVIRDHKVASLGDIEEGDVMFVSKSGDEYVIVVTSAKAEGTLTKVASGKVYVDGTKINETAVASVYYTTDNGDEYSKKADIADYDDMLGEDVVVYKDYEGRAIYIVSDVEETSTGWLYGLYIKGDTNIDGDLVRVVNAEGEIVTFLLAEDATVTGTPANKTDDGTNLTNLDGVRYKLNKDGEISELELVIDDAVGAAAAVTATDDDDDTITITGSGTLFVTSSTKIFKVTGLKNSELEPVEWSEIESAKSFTGVKAAVYQDATKSLAKLIVITEGFDQLADDTLYYAYVTAMAKINSDEYELTVDLGDEELDVVFDKDDIGAGVAVDTVITYNLNNSGNGISAALKAADATDVYVYDVDGSYIKFATDSSTVDLNYTKISDTVVVYDANGDKRDFADLEDHDGTTANKVTIYKNASGIVEAIIVGDFQAIMP